MERTASPVLRTIATAAGCMVLLAACGRDDDPEIEDQPLEPTVEPAAPAEETVPHSAPGRPVYEGVWAADPANCDVAPGSADPSPVAFVEGEFIGYENRCRVDDEREGTEGGYQLELFCQAEGVELRQTVDVDVDGEMLRVRWPDGHEAVYARCEKEDQL